MRTERARRQREDWAQRGVFGNLTFATDSTVGGTDAFPGTWSTTVTANNVTNYYNTADVASLWSNGGYLAYWSTGGVLGAPKKALPRARARARRLLKGSLSDAQREMLRKCGYFEVEGRSGQLYRIKTGIVRNVYRLDAKGREIEQLCAHPVGSIPDYDAMLAQKLMLEAAEEEFVSVANKTPLILPAAA